MMDAHGFIMPSRIIGVLFLFFALLPGAGAVWFYTSTSEFIRNATSASGVVIEVKPSSGGDGTTYHAVFEFSDAGGNKHQSVSGWSSNPPAYAVGETVEVLYSRSNPSDARLHSFLGLWVGAIACATLTIPPLALAVVFIWFVPFTIRRIWPTAPASSITPHSERDTERFP